MSHKITNNDAWFIAMGRVDPLAKEPFKVGDDVVVCAKCKTVHLEDIWNMEHQCAACGHQTQTSTFSRSFIDFSYGRATPSFLRWLQSPLLYHLRRILVYILPIIAVTICVAVTFFSSSSPAEDLRATWDMVLEFVPDRIATLQSKFTAAGQVLVERLNLTEIVTAIIGGITKLPSTLWHTITTGVMQFIQWIQAIFS